MDKPEVDAKKKLKAAAGAAPWTVLYCPTCVEQTLPETSEPHGRYEWAVSMHCGKCSTNWNICTICSKQRVHLITPPPNSAGTKEKDIDNRENKWKRKIHPRKKSHHVSHLPKCKQSPPPTFLEQPPKTFLRMRRRILAVDPGI